MHRDLKPANILMAEDGTPRITDFGLAKWLDAESGEHTSAALTEAESILGSPSYMAPEQAEGRSADTGRTTDVYALGVILYELLTGRPPFVGATKIQTMDLVRTAEPVPPSRHRPEVPSWLEAICLKCLEKSPGRRYPTAQALADDLGSWLRDERPEGIPNWFTKFGRGVRRHAAAVAGRLRPWSRRGRPPTSSSYAPERAIRRIEGELARGRPVTLIGTDRRTEVVPLAGRANRRGGRSSTRTTRSASNPGAEGLLELVPDPRSEQLSIHRADPPRCERRSSGEVGLYIARTAYPGDRARHPVLHPASASTPSAETRTSGRGSTRLAGKGELPRPPHQESPCGCGRRACSRTRRCLRTSSG